MDKYRMIIRIHRGRCSQFTRILTTPLLMHVSFAYPTLSTAADDCIISELSTVFSELELVINGSYHDRNAQSQIFAVVCAKDNAFVDGGTRVNRQRYQKQHYQGPCGSGTCSS